MPTNDPNVGVAFALVIGAGAATTLGAAVVFVPALVRYASRRTLAAALGLSSGVMTYVSFVEIFQKSNDSFVDAEKGEEKAYMFATVSFFGGVVLMLILNKIVTALLGGHHHHHHHNSLHEETGDETRDSGESRNEETKEDGDPPSSCDKDDIQPTCPCCTKDPAGQLDQYKEMAEEIEEFEEKEHHHWEGHTHDHDHGDSDLEARNVDVEDDDDDDDDEEEDEEQKAKREKDDHESQKLMRMSINTALAIGLHNFPEGLATFVAALNDTRVGAVLAVAIAIHNIPEGLCVAMPIYYATGNRWKAFWWAVLSGASEPIAALLGWAVLANSFSNTLYGSLFGVVSGMMVIISVRELLPTAHRYDTEDTVVTYSFMVGMGIMALSLVLFQL